MKNLETKNVQNIVTPESVGLDSKVLNNISSYLMTKYSSIDIDTQFDLDIAEFIMKKYNY